MSRKRFVSVLMSNLWLTFGCHCLPSNEQSRQLERFLCSIRILFLKLLVCLIEKKKIHQFQRYYSITARTAAYIYVKCISYIIRKLVDCNFLIQPADRIFFDGFLYSLYVGICNAIDKSGNVATANEVWLWRLQYDFWIDLRGFCSWGLTSSNDILTRRTRTCRLSVYWQKEFV